MISPIACVTALWVAWLVGWLVAARSTATTVARQSLTSRIAHSVFIWGGAALVFSSPPRFGILVRPLVPPSPWIAWGSVTIVAGGLAFAGWARVHLGRFWSGTVTLKAEHVLIRTGPYALARHPIYTGLLLALIGTAVVRGTLGALVGLVLLVLGVMLKISQEERLLVTHFGAAYRAYRAEVPAVVPRFGGRSVLIMLALVLGAVGCGDRRQAAASAGDTAFTAMQARGEAAMGVNQYTSAHVFESLPDGGRIILDTEADSAAVVRIRQHMQDIAAAFEAGDFTKPFQVHAERVPGTSVMAARRAAITYQAIDRPRGAEVRILTKDPTAVRAVHEFLAFQRDAHHAPGHN